MFNVRYLDKTGKQVKAAKKISQFKMWPVAVTLSCTVGCFILELSLQVILM